MHIIQTNKWKCSNPADIECLRLTLFWFYKAHCQDGFNEAIEIGHISSANIKREIKGKMHCIIY